MLLKYAMQGRREEGERRREEKKRRGGVNIVNIIVHNSSVK